jgi:hypothetical protein
LEARLQARSRESGTSLVRLRKAVVFDRLLARLVLVAPDRWVLKGALALDYRLGDRARTTKDVDLGRQDDEEAATADFLAAQAVDLRDHFVLVIQRTDRLDQLQDGVAVRYHAACELAGRPFDDVTIDVAFGDAPIGEPEVVLTGALLAFADIDPVQVPAIPLAQHAAEKVHAAKATCWPGTLSTDRREQTRGPKRFRDRCPSGPNGPDPNSIAAAGFTNPLLCQLSYAGGATTNLASLAKSRVPTPGRLPFHP